MDIFFDKKLHMVTICVFFVSKARFDMCIVNYIRNMTICNHSYMNIRVYASNVMLPMVEFIIIIYINVNQ